MQIIILLINLAEKFGFFMCYNAFSLKQEPLVFVFNILHLAT